MQNVQVKISLFKIDYELISVVYTQTSKSTFSPVCMTVYVYIYAELEDKVSLKMLFYIQSDK